MQYEFEETAGYLVYRVGRLLRFRAAQFFRERSMDISPEQWALLLQIAEKGQPVLSDLVDATINDHPNVTRLVAGLERTGYTQRAPNPDDRRSQLISITPAGEAFIQQVLPELISEKAEFFNGLDQNDVFIFIKSLKVILGNLEK